MDGPIRKNNFLNKDRKKKTHLIKHWHLAFSHVKQFKEAKNHVSFFKIIPGRKGRWQPNSSYMYFMRIPIGTVDMVFDQNDKKGFKIE